MWQAILTGLYTVEQGHMTICRAPVDSAHGAAADVMVQKQQENFDNNRSSTTKGLRQQENFNNKRSSTTLPTFSQYPTFLSTSNLLNIQHKFLLSNRHQDMASFATPSPKKGQFQSPIVRHKSASPWHITRFLPYLPRNPLIPGFSNLGIGSSIPNPLYQASSSAEQNNPPQRPESVVRLVLPFSLLEKVFIPTHHHQDYRYLGSQ
jgi:hypothetical protein